MRRWRIAVLVLLVVAAGTASVWWRFGEALARRAIAANLRTGDAAAIETALDRLYLEFPSEADRTVVGVLFAADHHNHDAVIEALEHIGKGELAPRPARIALAEKRLADPTRSDEARAREARYLMAHTETKDAGFVVRLVPHLPATRDSARALVEALGEAAAFDALLDLVRRKEPRALSLLAQGVGVPGRADEVVAAAGWMPSAVQGTGSDGAERDDLSFALAILEAALPSAPLREAVHVEGLVGALGSTNPVAALHLERAVAAGSPVPPTLFGLRAAPPGLAHLLERWGAKELDAPRADGLVLDDGRVAGWALTPDDHRLSIAGFAQLARRASAPDGRLAIAPETWTALVARAGVNVQAAIAGATPMDAPRLRAFVLDLRRLTRASGLPTWVPLGEQLVAIPRRCPDVGPVALELAGELAGTLAGESPAWTRTIADIARDSRVADPIRLAALSAAPAALDADALATLAARAGASSELRCLALDRLVALGVSPPGLYAGLLESDDERVAGRTALAIARGATELAPLLALIDRGAPQAEAVLPELARRGGDLAFEAIRARIGAADIRVRAAAVRALGAMGDPRAVEVLLPVLADRAAPVAIAQQAGQALAILAPAERLSEVLAAFADHSSVQLRLVVAEGLVSRGFRPVGAVLCELLSAEESWERDAAHTLLVHLAPDTDFQFRADDSPEERAMAVARWRTWAAAGR